MPPRLVLRDQYGHYCINGLIDPKHIPTQVKNEFGMFKLSRTTPTYVLYQEDTCPAVNVTPSPSGPSADSPAVS